MELLKHLATVLRHPSILRPYKRVLLLSHMRANTSLFGHLLGSNPEIEGYYELHIGYYSWKSFIRQKLKYFAEHAPKAGAKYIFDKVLAEEHFIETSLFSKRNDKIIVMIREPNASILSIMKLYQKVDPTHEYTTIEGASKYYSNRLKQLVEMAKSIKEKYLFIEADNLIQHPDETLKNITQYLALSAPLTKEYKIFPKTGEKRVGDSSKNISSGIITPKETQNITLDGLDKDIIEQYKDTLNTLKFLSVSIK